MFSKSAREQAAPNAPAHSWSLAARLTAWYAASSFLLIVLATGTLYVALVRNLEREDVLTLRDQVRVLRQVLQNGPGSAETLRREAEWMWAARQSSLVHVRVLNRAGQPIVETPGMNAILAIDAFPPPIPADEPPGDGQEHHSPSGKTYRLIAAVAPSTAGDGHVVQVALDETPDEELIADYRRNLAMVLGLALIACTIGGYQIAKRGVRPLHTITETAHRVRPTHLDERIALAGLPAELQRLGQTFNGMLDRLAEAFDRLARFSSEIAHELRTPINNLRGEVEVALGKERSADEYRDTLGSALEECDRLTRMIDGLLFLARAEHPSAQTNRDRLDLGAELETVRAFYEAAAAEAGIHLELRSTGTVIAYLDRSLLQRAVGNLVANALAHTPRGGTVTLAALTEADGASVVVSDSGCGIDTAHFPYLFDRFYRVDRARSSATGNVGLGLAIVKGIVELHGGAVRVESEVGVGTRFILHFPPPVPPSRR